nr:immunoglobulin heavy chain junction region [Macaca mulatta]MOX37854.1 immunoglobulin heavy chain junction region [Macaca mulatta]MOX38204.1 immunoglobulin heavy chain junction region [Macaca mulatta]MOX38279.1 immunoglobulin heavy chain junction region [Macaca mulatta]MOX38343.1 immunoglobulin heavy chain junction region [Macaca mulatta]
CARIPYYSVDYW